MRNSRLDILRCIAVLLVLGRHGLVQGVWFEVGWAGVDLFFVLSGFLVSGLLFTEYKRTQSISLPRFFIRRGFKIYPAFWAMLVGSFLIAQGYGLRVPGIRWLWELLFVQNYKPSIWRHTWSLAVEEHFYIILPLLLVALNWLSKCRRDPFWFIPYAFCILAPLTMVMRYIAVHQVSYRPDQFGKVMFVTHLRIDALFFGVLLGYFYHFRPKTLASLLRNRRTRIAAEVITALLVSCCLIFPVESVFMQSFGLTLIYLGFGGLLALCLTAGGPRRSSAGPGAAPRKIGGVLAFIGRYSYSIYLWHLPVLTCVLKGIQPLSKVTLSAASLTYIYIAISIPFGILMACIVEFPALKLRDRLFPRTSSFAIPNSPEAFEDAEQALTRAPVAWPQHTRTKSRAGRPSADLPVDNSSVS